MKILKTLVLVLLSAFLVLSLVSLLFTYTVLSSVFNPSLYMAALEASGGVDKLVSNATSALLEELSADYYVKQALAESIRSTITPATVHHVLQEVLSSIRDYLSSGKGSPEITMSTEELKSTFLATFKKNYTGPAWFIDEFLSRIPDKLGLTHALPPRALRELVQPYRTAVVIERASAVACLGAAIAAALVNRFSRPSLRWIGASAVLGALTTSGAIATLSSVLQQKFAENLPAMQELPAGLNPGALLAGAVKFVNQRAYVGAGIVGCIGAAMFLAGQTRHSAPPSSSSSR